MSSLPDMLLLVTQRNTVIITTSYHRPQSMNMPQTPQTAPELFWTMDLKCCRNKLPRAADPHSGPLNFPIMRFFFVQKRRPKDLGNGALWSSCVPICLSYRWWQVVWCVWARRAIGKKGKHPSTWLSELWIKSIMATNQGLFGVYSVSFVTSGLWMGLSVTHWLG